MPSDLNKARELFLHAVGKLPPEEWDNYVVEACGGDAELKQQVENLLRVHREAGSFLAQPAIPVMATGTYSPRPDEAAAVNLNERPGTVIGPYKLREQIGEGGFGLVFMAEQQHPVRRKVAIKVIKPGMDNRQVIARFEAERQALALMDHPNIARVMDAGETESGRPYFAMELVRGVPITDYCDEHKLTTRQRLELFLPVCQAVMHAHQRGIIHRDIKPSNVLVTLHDGIPVIKVIDFGIAKALGQQLTDKTLCTGYAQLVGTPMYMSPEQAELSGLEVDTRCDIYSLGVLLYELLTGSTPFDKKRLREAGYDEMRRIIREEEPVRPSTRMSTLGQAGSTVSALRQSDQKRLSQLFRGELDWMVMKALEKDRTRRYETAGSFAADVQRFLRDEPVLACPPSSLYLLRKFARRNRWPLTLASAAAVSLVIFACGSLIWSLYLREALHEAENNRNRAEGAEQAARVSEAAAISAREAANQSERAARVRLFESLMIQARAGRLSRQLSERTKSLEILKEATRLARALDLLPARAAELRNEVIACLARPDMDVAKEWNGWPGDSMLLDFDGRLERYARTDRQGIVHIHSAVDGVELWPVPSFGPEDFGEATVPHLSLDGRLLLLQRGSRVKLWDLAGRQPASIPVEQDGWKCSAFSPDNRELVLIRLDGSIHVYDLPSGQKRKQLPGDPMTRAVAYHPKARQVAIDHETGVQLRDLTTGEVVGELPQATDCAMYFAMAWHPAGKLLAITGDDLLIHVWDVETRQPIARMEGNPHGGHKFTFDHSGELLAGSGWDGLVHLWDARTGQELFSTQADCHCARFSPDDQTLAVGIGVDDNKLRFWKVVRSNIYRTLTTRAPGIHGMNFSPRDRLVAVRGVNGSIAFLDPKLGTLLGRIDSIGPSLVFEPSGDMLSASSSGLLRWPIHRDADVPGFLKIGPPENLPLATPDNIAISSNGRMVASSGHRHSGSRGLVWDRDRTGPPIPLPYHEDSRNIGLSPDGLWVATGSHFGSGVVISSACDGQQVAELPVDGGSYIHFSPDGRWLVTTGGHCRLWSVPSWKEGPYIGGTHAGFSSDGKLMAVETGRGVIRLVDPNTGREYVRLEDPNQDRAYHIIFSQDNSQLFVATSSSVLRVWELRAIRRQLVELDLDWELPPLPNPSAEATHPMQVQIDLGEVLARNLAAKKNEEAWKLVVCRNVNLRDPHRAVALAREATHLAPDEAFYWNTLGVAYYRAGRWDDSICALDKSMQLMPGKYESFNTFFLAMAHRQRNDHEQARQWFDQAVAWLEKHRPDLEKGYQEELSQFRAEAAALLGPKTKK